jgi:hypothetical protein
VFLFRCAVRQLVSEPLVIEDCNERLEHRGTHVAIGTTMIAEASGATLNDRSEDADD